MTLEEFVEKYKGYPVDFDGLYGAQCVDLVRQYMKDVWGFTRQPEGVIGADAFYINHNVRPIQQQLCKCTPYTGSVQPPAGSIVIFRGNEKNKFGHIAVCITSTRGEITCFEQDGIVNSVALQEGKPQKGAYVGTWSYDRLLGWLEKKEK